MRADWVVVVPVKPLAAAKSRLRGAIEDSRHEELAYAMVCDTVAAAHACPVVTQTLVVTDDPVVAPAVASLGARVVPDVPAAGLNAAARYGADTAAGTGHWRAVLAGDLPALRPEELAGALAAAIAADGAPAPRNGAGVRCFVRDAVGTGTVLLTAPPGTPLDPRFGVDSAAAHAARGARELTGDWPGLRRDVDVAADLWKVLTLGAGPRTRALAAALTVPAARGGRR